MPATSAPSFLDRLRGAIPASSRGRIHATAASAAAVLLAYGWATETEIAAIVGVVIAVADLLLATLHAQTKVRGAFYGVAAAVAAGATSLGYMTDVQQVEILGLVAAVLGTAGAGAMAPDPDTVEVPDGAIGVFPDGTPVYMLDPEADADGAGWGRVDGED